MATVSQIAIRSLCVGSRNSIQALLLFTLRINARVFNSRLEYQEGGGARFFGGRAFIILPI